MTQNKPMTLRHLCAMLEPEYLDAPLSFAVRDGNLNLEVVPCPDSLWEMPRRSAKPATNEPASLYLNVTLCRTRLVRRKSAKKEQSNRHDPREPLLDERRLIDGVWHVWCGGGWFAQCYADNVVWHIQVTSQEQRLEIEVPHNLLEHDGLTFRLEKRHV